jgi:hypothetical protein
MTDAEIDRLVEEGWQPVTPGALALAMEYVIAKHGQHNLFSCEDVPRVLDGRPRTVWLWCKKAGDDVLIRSIDMGKGALSMAEMLDMDDPKDVN